MYEYEKGFQYLDQLIYSNEQLNSFLHASKDECIEKIKNQNPYCNTINIINIKKKKQIFEIQKRQTLSSLHPLSKQYYSQQTQCFSIRENIVFIEKILPNFELDISKVDYFNIYKNQNYYSITVSQQGNWEELELNHLRYYFFIQEISKSYDFVLKSIKYSSLFNSNHEVLMNAYQRLKFEINLHFYEILKDYNIKIEECSLKVKDEYNRIDYVITILVFLEKLMESIDKRYENCIEKTFNISSISMRSSLLQLQNKIQFIEDSLNFSIIHKELKAIVLNVLRDFKQNSLNDHVNFKRYNYINVFTNYFEKLFLSCIHLNQLTTNRFIEFLIEMNFNEYNFLNWLSLDLKEKAQELNDPSSQIQYFMNLNTKFLNFPIRVHSMYVDSKIDLKTQLLSMISNELNSLNYVSVEKIKVNNVKASKSKMKLKKNSNSMILLLKVMNETNFINKMTSSELARFFCDNFSSDNKQDFSFDSIRNKLYEKDPQTKQDLIIELKNFIAAIDKNSF